MTYTITTSVDVDASPHEVWDVLSDFAAYGQWSSFSRVRGAARLGARLKMAMPGLSFPATVTAAEPGRRLQWTGTIASARLFCGQHTFELTALPGGGTHVVNREDFSGVLTTLAQPLMKTSNDHGYEAFNASLKERVESCVKR